ALDQFALVGLAGDDGAGLDGLLAFVEAQVRLAGGAIGTVAGEAVLGKDRPDVAVVLQLLGRAGAGGANHRGTEAQRRQQNGKPGSTSHDDYLLYVLLCVSVPLWLVSSAAVGMARLQ